MSPGNLLWTFLPDALLPVAIVGIGLLVILGVFTIRRAVGVIATLILFIVTAPFVESLFASLPWWIAVLVMVWIGLAVVRGVLALFLGDRAAGHAVGEFFVLGVVGGFRLAIQLAMLPFRLAAAIARAVRERRVA